MTVLVTGASGFIGSALVTRLSGDHRISVRAAVRNLSGQTLPESVDTIQTGDLASDVDWHTALMGIDAVIHTVGLSQPANNKAGHPLAEFRAINLDAAINLANQAAKAGVRRFIYISSIKVNGEETKPGQPYTALDKPDPVDFYGLTKHEAEKALRRLAAESGMEVVIIRPPLVYGPGVQGNFLSMMRWLDKGIPLPFGLIRNKRTLIALDNLVDLIITCIRHPSAADQTFLAGDDEDLSTTELLQRLAHALGKNARLLPVPAWVLSIGLGVLGKRSAAQKLCGSLQVNIEKTKEMLGWTPPMSVDEALRRTAEHYLRTAE